MFETNILIQLPALSIKEENGRIILESSMSMEEAFGTGGKEMRQVAKEISKDRRKEVESERKKLSF